MFGLRMSVTTHLGRRVLMKPIDMADAPAMAAGFANHRVTRTLTATAAYTPEQEEEWITKAAADPTSYSWGLYCEGELIGNTSLNSIKDRRATSGCCIFREDLWGDGIITAAHHARMYYAVQILGLEAVSSHVLQGNNASRRALARVGYVRYGMQFSLTLSDGAVGHVDDLLWVNPQEHRQASFWGGQPVPRTYAKRFQAGHERAQIALDWAAENVTWL